MYVHTVHVYMYVTVSVYVRTYCTCVYVCDCECLCTYILYMCIRTVGGKSLVTFSFYKTVHRFCFYARKYKYGTEQNETEINGKP